MYIYIYIYTYYVCTMNSMQTSVLFNVYRHVFIHIYLYTYKSTCIYRVYTYTVYTYTYIHIYIYISICIYIHIYIYICAAVLTRICKLKSAQLMSPRWGEGCQAWTPASRLRAKFNNVNITYSPIYIHTYLSTYKIPNTLLKHIWGI